MTESIKENRKEIVNMEKKVGGEHFQDTDFERIQELINATPEKLIEDDLMDINASKLVPDTKEEDAEASPGNKSAIDNLVEGFWLFKTAFDFFYYIDPSMTQTLELKQIVGKELVPHRNIFR